MPPGILSDSAKATAEYSATPPTLADGAREDLQVDSRGALYTVVRGPNSAQAANVGSPSDAFSNANVGIVANDLAFFFNGASWDRARTPNVFKTIQNIAVAVGTPVTVWTPTAGKKFRLMGFMLSLSVAGRILLKDSGSEFARTGDLGAALGQASPPMGNGFLSAVANQLLQVDVTAAGNVNGFVFGTEE